MNDDHTFAPEMTAEEAIQMVLKRPEMYGLQRVTAVPDAGEPLTDDLEKLHGIIEQFRARGIKYKAERDAALAAIERVRSINTGNNRALYGNDFEAGMAKALWLVKAALDGAPEPEWEYGSGPEDALDQSGLHTSRKAAERGVAEWNEFTQRSERMGGRPLERLVLVRRRKAGPWLPVEGESGDA